MTDVASISVFPVTVNGKAVGLMDGSSALIAGLNGKGFCCVERNMKWLGCIVSNSKTRISGKSGKEINGVCHARLYNVAGPLRFVIAGKMTGKQSTVIGMLCIGRATVA